MSSNAQDPATTQSNDISTLPPPLPCAEEGKLGDTDPLADTGPWNGNDSSTTGASTCPQCQAPAVDGKAYCSDCGWVFADGVAASNNSVSAEPAVPAARVKGRYELVKLLNERGGGIRRYQALDHGSGASRPVPVVILRVRSAVEALQDAEVVGTPVDEDATLEVEIKPFEEQPTSHAITLSPPWPGIAWERFLLTRAKHPALPEVLEFFVENGWEYLVEEVPSGGPTLWDAWDDPSSTSDKRYTWLIQVAEGLQQLHRNYAMLEAIRPDHVIISPTGQARIANITDLLPLPLSAEVPLRATLYTAPELILKPEEADARAALYSFGAMIYSLVFTGRELIEKDFERPGEPKPFLPLYPDVHPTFGRLLMKTFCRDLDYRFPTDEAKKTDATGFAELIKTLEVCRHTLDNVHLEIAAWTTTGMVRTGNEDAFALLHAMESRQDDLGESALVLLADGMGGYEAGEIASALAIKTLRKTLLQHKMFAALAGDTPAAQAPFDLEACKKLIYDALKEANKVVFEAPRQGIGKRGMGCTAEVVYINGQNLVVGHVGDSRTYHLHERAIKQVTRDQTLVNRLVELGQITAEEAESHPRRSELQQAIGGRAHVEPVLYHDPLTAGDWILVCSDGLTNHINAEELKQMMQLEAGSAETAARRLVNFVNLRGATDNATVVVVRAT